MAHIRDRAPIPWPTLVLIALVGFLIALGIGFLRGGFQPPPTKKVGVPQPARAPAAQPGEGRHRGLPGDVAGQGDQLP